jgi:beta-1,4-N-acetylglucosaminyltransferase
MADTWKWTSGSKLCFVTTGATAPFTALIESVLHPSTLDTLAQNGYTHLLVQYGSAKEVFEKAAHAGRAHLDQARTKSGLVIDGIDFNPEGLQAQFKLVQQSKGLVISHAGNKAIMFDFEKLLTATGSGSILEALRYQIPLIVVPNTALLDNHQEELTVVMQRSNYLLRGDVK